MEDKDFIENGFIIDLSNSNDAANIIYELSNILEIPQAKNKNICLKLGKIDLTQSQLLSIKSLITSMNSELAFIETSSEQTKLSAQNLRIKVSELTNQPEEEIKTEEEEEEKKEKSIENNEKIQKNCELEISKLPTLYLQQNLRSGQTMSYDGNIVLIGDANPGSEIIAKGDITVWGVLGGIAHAGARGNDFAKIRALKLNAIQLRISGFYARRPDAVNIPFIQRSKEFIPEEARVDNKEIALYKIGE